MKPPINAADYIRRACDGVRDFCAQSQRVEKKVTIAAQLIFHKAGIQGWSSGIPTDSEDTMRVAVLTGVRPMIEKFPFAKVNEAYERMASGHAQFRVVITM